jgi:ribosome maturation factor RimP
VGDLPTFRLYKMNELVKNIKELLDPDIHLMDVQENNQRDLVKVIVDSEKPITIDTIASITRTIRDSEVMDKHFPNGYKMEVTSAGIDTDLEQPFQFRKNIGRQLKLKLIAEDSVKSMKATLKDIDDKGIFIQFGKKISHINYADIKQAKIIVSFS